MEVDELVARLGYDESENYLSLKRGNLESAPDYGHVFRRAMKEPCCLRGVYTLHDPSFTASKFIVPIVYVCEAQSDDEADQVHRLVWNQDVVPFLLLRTPTTIRLYSGFRYQKDLRGPAGGVLRVLRDFNQVGEIVDSFRAESIDDGRLWRAWAKEVTLEHRVDWKLLANLRELDRQLQEHMRLKKETSHALIGKYVYLHYLRDRRILSPRKLNDFAQFSATLA